MDGLLEQPGWGKRMREGVRSHEPSISPFAAPPPCTTVASTGTVHAGKNTCVPFATPSLLALQWPPPLAVTCFRFWK